MKRATSIIAAFCFGLFISISILACAVDDYAAPNANNPSSDLQLLKMDCNFSSGEASEHYNISYGSDGRITSITYTYYTTGTAEDSYEVTRNITYDKNKVILSSGDEEWNFTFNNELDSYSAETINNQVFNCLLLQQ